MDPSNKQTKFLNLALWQWQTFLRSKNSSKTLSFLSSRTTMTGNLNKNIGIRQIEGCISNLIRYKMEWCQFMISLIDSLQTYFRNEYCIDFRIQLKISKDTDSFIFWCITTNKWSTIWNECFRGEFLFSIWNFTSIVVLRKSSMQAYCQRKRWSCRFVVRDSESEIRKLEIYSGSWHKVDFVDSFFRNQSNILERSQVSLYTRPRITEWYSRFCCSQLKTN